MSKHSSELTAGGPDEREMMMAAKAITISADSGNAACSNHMSQSSLTTQLNIYLLLELLRAQATALVPNLAQGYPQQAPQGRKQLRP